jgi:DNA-binding transcriptional regulator YdaS (Cro superfamily)|tara:strand:+ start:347 stop:556 length:210 start_codon:yes stop_codon:yes gene_type:complete
MLGTNKMASPIERAVAYFGSQVKLAKRLGETPQNVHHWVRKGRIPNNKAVAVAVATNNEITVEQILLNK